MLTTIKPSNKDIATVKTPQSVVHIKHSITLRQYKIWVILLQRFRDFYEKQESPDENGFYSISTDEIKGFLGYEAMKEELKSDLEKLRKEPIILNYLEKDNMPVMHGMGFLSEWKVTTKKIRFRLPSFLENVMKGLDQSKAMFQLLNWQIFNHFTGKYEAIIYKLCRDYIGVKNTPYMTIGEFRNYMGLKDGEYKEFLDLNKFVIKKPVEKINESSLSDIEVTIQYRTEGRKKLGLYFVVSRKNQTSIPFPETEENPAFRFAKVRIEPTTQIEYLAQRQPDEIGLCIERANEYGEGEAAKGKTPNYGAIYRKAISEGWHISYADKKAKQEAIEGAKRKATKEASEADKAKAKKDLEQTKWIEETLAKFDALEAVRRMQLVTTYAAGLPDFTRKSFDKHGGKHPMHRFAFSKFVEQQLYK
jgi:plasmid replication initiation protein